MTPAMPHKLAHDARGLVALAISNAERRSGVHPGVLPHLKAARTQLDAVCAVLDARPPDLDADPPLR